MKDKLFLIYGEEPYLINKKIDEIIDFSNAVIYDMSTSSMEEVREDVMSYSLFSNNKDILCKNCLFLTASTSDKDNITILEDILKVKLDNRLILSVESEVDGRKKIVKDLLKLGTSYTFIKLKEYEITNYIGEEFKRLGYKIDLSTLNYFQKFIGNNLSIISKEIEKMILFKDNKEITKEDINQISSKTLEENIFELVDAVINKKINKALNIYDDFQIINEEEIKLISMLGDQFRLIFQVKTFYNMGYTKEDIIKQLGVHPYRIKLAGESTLSIEDAKKYLLKLFDLDVSIKTGIKDKKQAFKMFLLKI